MTPYPVIDGNCWTEQFSCGFFEFVQPGHPETERHFNFAGASGWHLLKKTGIRIATSQTADGVLHGIVESEASFVAVLGDPPVDAIVTVECLSRAFVVPLPEISDLFSVGLEIKRASDGVVLYSTGRDVSGALIQLPVTNGSVWIGI